MAASNLETRLERGKLDELTVTKIISMLRSSQDKVKFISDNLRAYAHPREHFVQKENIKFKNFVSEVFDQLKNAYSIEQVLEMDVDEEATIWENPLFLERVVFHLLENAIIANHKATAKKIFVKLEKEKAAYRFTIADEGGGIELDQQFYVTKPFFQLQENLEHNGIGLSLVEYICKHNNVSFKIENREKGLLVSMEQQEAA